MTGMVGLFINNIKTGAGFHPHRSVFAESAFGGYGTTICATMAGASPALLVAMTRIFTVFPLGNPVKVRSLLPNSRKRRNPQKTA